MFKFARKREVLWPVTITFPADGGPQKAEVKVRYKLLSVTELAEFLDRARSHDEATAEGAKLAAERIAQQITGWEGVLGEDGEAIEYSHEMALAFLDVPYVRVALELGLYSASQGALAKN